MINTAGLSDFSTVKARNGADRVRGETESERSRDALHLTALHTTTQAHKLDTAWPRWFVLLHFPTHGQQECCCGDGGFLGCSMCESVYGCVSV